MKKHSRIVFFTAACLAGFIGQLAAFGATTNSVWDLTSISTFKAGKINVVETNPATAVFLSDGTASLLVGTNQFAGTYTNTTKQLTLTPGAGGLAGIASNAVALINAAIDDPAITITAKSVKFNSKIKLSKTGVPVSTTDTVSGKGSETVKGKVKSKSFTLKTLWKDWTWSSGTSTNF
jgi:hypothetical protein